MAAKAKSAPANSTGSSKSTASSSHTTTPSSQSTNGDQPVKFPDASDENAESPSVIGVPQAIRPAATSMSKSIVWIYGPPKIGKTTFASQFPGAWFLATEPGQNFVTIHEPTLIQDWDHFLQLCTWIQENRPTRFGDGQPIHTLVIDTVDLLFRMCTEWVCSSLGVEDPGELDHGKGWSRLSSEFTRVLTKVAKWPYTLVCISHAREREFKTRGSKTNRYEPDIGAAGMRVLNAAADLILYAHTDQSAVRDDKGEITGEITEQRQLMCHPSSSALAGGRMSHLLPPTVPLSYGELTKAFTKGGRP